MSKVLKAVSTIAATVATVAAVIPGGQGIAAIAGAVSAVTSIGAQLTAPKPVARGSTTNLILDAEPPRPYMIGESFSAGVLRHRVGYGPTLKKVPNPYLWEVKVFSGVGPVQQLVQEQFDFAAIGPYYTGFYSSDTQLGARPESTALVPPFNAPATGWGASHKLSGCAAIGSNYKFDKDGKVFASGLPVHGAIWKGEKVYDPRLDSTYPGGSGSHRLGTESTYTYSTNPALHAATYAYGRYQNGIKIFGLGMASDGIDWAAVVDWANDCDTNGWEAHGTIYEGGRGADVERQRVQNLDDICAAGGGRWLVAGATLSFDWHRPRVPLATLTDDDLLEEGGSATAVQSIRDRMNGVRPQYISPTHNWEQITADEIVGTTYRTEDGTPLTQTWPLNLVKNAGQAGELTSYALVDSREIGPIELNCKAEWRFYKPGETITVNSTLLGYNGPAVIVQRDFEPQTMAVKLVLKSETAAKHDFALGKVASPPPTPTLLQSQEERDLAVYGAITPRATDVEFDDDATVESLKPAEPGATEGAVVPTPGSGASGNVKDEGGNLYDPGELLNASMELTPSGQLQFRPLPGSEAVVRGQITLPDIGAASEVALRRAEDDVDALANALATALDEASRTRETFTDAGFFVDEATGQVRIHAVEQTTERLNTVDIRLDAAEASINLRATTSYVDQAIAEAVLDPSQIADLDAIFVRLTAAELDIDGLEATVTTLATVTELTALTGRVTTAESELDALEGTVSTKVDTTTFNALETRVTSAETTLTALGDTAQIVNDVTSIRLIEREVDANAEGALAALVQDDRNQRDQVAAVASARQELRTEITDGLTAEATARLALQVEVANNAASLATESLTRASEDEALASQISALEASTDTSVAALTASIGAEQTARTNADSALAADITALDASFTAALDTETAAREAAVTTLTASISAESTARASADTAIAADVTTLQAGLATEISDRTAAVTAANQARVDGDAALAADITALEADLATETSQRTAAITAEQQARVDGDAAEAAARTALAARVTTAEADIDANTAAITAEQTARANADSAIAASVTALTTTVNGNSATLTTFGESINGLQARQGVRLDVNGYVTGFVQNNDGAQGDFIILADRFAIVDPAGGAGQTAVVPFEVVSGNVRIGNDVSIGGDLIVDGSIQTGAIADNAVTRGNSAFIAAATGVGTTSTQVASVSLTTTGGSVRVDFGAAYAQDNGAVVAGIVVTYRIKRGTTVVRTGTYCEVPGIITAPVRASETAEVLGEVDLPGAVSGSFHVFAVDDAAPAGTHTYSVELQTSAGTGLVESRQIGVIEFKK